MGLGCVSRVFASHRNALEQNAAALPAVCTQAFEIMARPRGFEFPTSSFERIMTGPAASHTGSDGERVVAQR
jgi:hypothetical protein